MSASPSTRTPCSISYFSVRPESATNASCVATMPAISSPTLTTSFFIGVERLSKRESFKMASTRRLRRCTSEFTVSRRSSSASNPPSTIASTVDWMAISGVRSSCATSVVRRRSSSRSRSMESAIASNVSPRCAISSSPCSSVRADRSPSLMAFAVVVMRLMGLTSVRANKKPMHDASTMASAVANTMAWYELLRNSSSV